MNLLNLTVFLFCTAKCLSTPPEDDWLSRIHCETTYDTEFVELLNGLKTVESINGKGPVHIDEMDKSLLTNPCYGRTVCMNVKSFSIEKYKKKMEALQCVNGVIVYYFLNEIKNVLIEKKPSKLKGPTVYFYPIKIMRRMLVVLYRSKTFAHNWLWIIFIRLQACVSWPYYFLPDNILDFSQHEKDLLNYIQLCRNNNYLPSSDVSPSDSKVFYDTMVGQDIHGYIKNVYGAELSKKMPLVFYWTSMFKVDFLVLADYFHRDTDLFGSSKTGNVVWGASKKLLKVEKQKLAAAYRTMEWVTNPFAFIEYHTRVLRIMKANAYYHIWSHLMLFSVTLSQAKEHAGGVFQLRVRDCNIWKSMYYQIGIVGQGLYSDDPVFSSVVQQLFENLKKFDFEFVNRLHSMTEALQRIIHKELTMLGVDENDIMDTFNVNCYLYGGTSDGDVVVFDDPVVQLQWKEACKTEMIYHNLLQLGANENDARRLFYETWTVEDGVRCSDWEKNNKNSAPPNIDDSVQYREQESMDTEKNDSHNSQLIENSINHQSIEYNMIIHHTHQVMVHAWDLRLKFAPLDSYYILFYSNGNRELNDTFFPNIYR
ncbi:uncharacterized protein LOC126844642 isoform X2 [Adelges cooleyi]|uniref:uncharacterized protein LOC126844642 isoform X2 n=1 Tax=Adelges cooleyi TaxID=133065 RepID=UPI002180296E|nr:uncharacterized protein LOC126844642 isoform X2 [Adelges cooleyi]